MSSPLTGDPLMSRRQLERQIDEVLRGPGEVWEKVLFVDGIASAYHAESARCRAEVVRTQLAAREEDGQAGCEKVRPSR